MTPADTRRVPNGSQSDVEAAAPQHEHYWRVSNYPGWARYPFVTWAGTLTCRDCRETRYMTPQEEAQFFR